MTNRIYIYLIYIVQIIKKGVQSNRKIGKRGK